MSGVALITRTDMESLGAVLASSWWMLALRGIAALMFGALALVSPTLALSILTVLFGVYALADAGAAVVSLALGRWEWPQHWWIWIVGAGGAVAGAAAFVWPDITAMLVIYLIAAWACVSGTVQLVGAGILRREQFGSEWLLLLSGAMSVFFGAMIFVVSVAGSAALTSIVAVYSLVYGAALTGLAITLRRHASKVAPNRRPTPPRQGSAALNMHGEQVR